MGKHVSVFDDMAVTKLGLELYFLESSFNQEPYYGIDFLCIGTDRATGDSLGPLVGEFMAPFITGASRLFGTLDKPVHAGNLTQVIEEAGWPAKGRMLIAVDACLGRASSVGNITIGQGSLLPGAGLSKNLPAVGDIYITGVVNARPGLPGTEGATLQSTRLSMVMRMARAISRGILLGLFGMEDVELFSGNVPLQAHEPPDCYYCIDDPPSPLCQTRKEG